MRELDDLFGSFEVEASVVVGAPQERVWAVVTDVARMSEFSPELVEARWLEGATGPVAGARFAGTNRIGGYEWTRTCTVIHSYPPSYFAYLVGDRFDGSPSARWIFEMKPIDNGTVLIQRFAHEPEGRSGTRIVAEQNPDRAEEIIQTRRQALQRGMKATLDSIKKALEKG